MKTFIFTLTFLTLTTLSQADCIQECNKNGNVNLDARVICVQVCQNTEAIREVVDVLRQQLKAVQQCETK